MPVAGTSERYLYSVSLEKGGELKSIVTKGLMRHAQEHHL